MIDNHVHSNISYDGKSKIDEYLNIVQSKDITEITFTEHLDLIKGIPNIDLDNYYKQFLEYEQRSPIPINFGLEVGLSPEYNERISKILNNYPFDFIIASSHTLKNYILGENEELIENYSQEEITKMYYEEVLDNINSFSNYDVYGHLDHILRYIDHSDFDSYNDNKKIIDEILISLIKKEKGIEVNSSGFRFGCNNPHPSIEILKRYKNLGGKILTIGSDAHKYWELSRDLDITLDVLEECGFDTINIFHQRKPDSIKVKTLRKGGFLNE